MERSLPINQPKCSWWSRDRTSGRTKTLLVFFGAFCTWNAFLADLHQDNAFLAEHRHDKPRKEQPLKNALKAKAPWCHEAQTWWGCLLAVGRIHMSSHNDPEQWTNADQCYWCFLIGSEVPQGHPVWLRDASSDDSAVVQPSSSSKFGISWHQSWSFFQFFRSQMGKEDLQLVLLTSREPLQSSTASGRTAILSTQGGKGKSGSVVALSHWAATSDVRWRRY